MHIEQQTHKSYTLLKVKDGTVIPSFIYIYIYIYIKFNYTLNKLVLGTAVSAFTTRPQLRFYSIKCKL